VSAILLLLPRGEAQEKIASRIDIGQNLLGEPIQTRQDIDRVKSERKIWRSYNKQLLRTLFSSDEPAVEYEGVGIGIGGGIVSPDREVWLLHKDIERDLTQLRAILQNTELYQEAPTVSAASVTARAVPGGHAVFIVHGRAGREHEVARTVEQLGAEAVVLQERLHHGTATLIEKLEREASACGYAIVVYTGDDEGRIVGATDLDSRARENVVLELGYFVGLLGREKVTILRDPDVTVPSDFQGAAYYTLDEAGAWKARIEGELRNAGLID
jgi:predicted nucleotide-binding protein